MGQFWDMADDLCMEKFYSDLENNVYETNEQRENAFDVALHRRDTMREEMEKLYNRCVLPAPISDVMKIPYRAEIVWLVIRHALSWHDNPDGVAGCVSYYAPLNRSDQPQPKIELKLKGIGNPSLNCRPDEAARGLYTVDKLRDTQGEERGEMRLPPAGKGSAEGKRGRRYSSLPG